MLVLNAFLAISEGLVSDNQSSPLPPPHLPRDLPLRSHLVRLLSRSHHPVKNIWLFFHSQTSRYNSNRRFLHLIGYQPIKVLHSLRYLYFVSFFLHYQFPLFCTLSADQIQEICPCILLESKLWVRSVLFLYIRTDECYDNIDHCSHYVPSSDKRTAGSKSSR